MMRMMRTRAFSCTYTMSEQNPTATAHLRFSHCPTWEGPNHPYPRSGCLPLPNPHWHATVPPLWLSDHIPQPTTVGHILSGNTPSSRLLCPFHSSDQHTQQRPQPGQNKTRISLTCTKCKSKLSSTATGFD